MKFKTLFTLLFFATVLTAQNAPSTFREFKQVYTTYPFSDPSPVPMLSHVYPYFRFDGFTDKPIQKEWKVIEIENDYIKLNIFPEIGGKIWVATDKTTNQPFLYHNRVVKFRDVAMRGPWTSGGLEANYGTIGHTPNCSTPVDYKTTKNEDGSVTCTVGVLDLLTRTTWRMEINLPKDKAYFTTNSFWYNNTEMDQPYYHWMNAGLPVKGNLEFLYPGNKHIGHDGEFASWPINKENGKNINFYDQNDFGGYKSYHVFGKYSHYSGAYYHEKEFGTIRYGDRTEKAGKKLWVWGLSEQGMIWEDLLTDTDGQYFELQSGRLFNQNAEKSVYSPFKHKSFDPYATDMWTEYWYPIIATKGAVEANEYGALNVKHEDGWLKLYFCPAQNINENLIVTNGEHIEFQKALNLKPMQLFKDSIKCSAPTSAWKVTLGNKKLSYSFDEKEYEMNRPVETPTDFDWQSIQGLYLLAKGELAQKLYAKAEIHLQAVLEKDRNYYPALVSMAELMYRDLRYAEALVYVKRALSIDTHDGSANYFYGLINVVLNNQSDAKDGFDMASISASHRSAAYTELSKIYLREKAYLKALLYAQKATDFNRFNISALQIMAIAYRYLNDDINLALTLKTIVTYDKIGHFVNFENFFKNQNAESKSKFRDAITNELPNETYIELAIFYHNVGCNKEAIQLFEFATPTPESTFWLWHLRGDTINYDKLDMTFSFPFRSETGRILELLLQKNNSWKLKYQLALIYADRNRIKECNALLESCKDEPNFAPFYAMRAALNKTGNKETNVRDLKKALMLDNHWRYIKLLADYYIETSEHENARALLQAQYKTHPSQYIIGLLYAKSLFLCEKYAEADKLLTNLKIIPFEAATEARDIYYEVKLIEAWQSIKAKKYSKAMAFIEQAKLYPANLGTGKPYENEIDYRIEYWMSYICYTKMGKQKEAYAFLQKIVNLKLYPLTTGANYAEINGLINMLAYDKMGQIEKGFEWCKKNTKESDLIINQYRTHIAKGNIDLIKDEKKIAARLLMLMLNM